MTGCKEDGGGDPATLSGIAVTAVPAKTSYAVGETLDLTGMVVTATYSDDSSKAVTGYATDPVHGTALDTAGPVTVNVSYTEGGVTKDTTTSVTVNPPGNPTPAAADYDISGVTAYSFGATITVTITPKDGKSPGAVTVYYTGTDGTTYAKSATVPTAVGKYAVTFDVAAAAGWNAAAGLAAPGTLEINNKAAPSITTWPTAAAITYGAKLSDSELTGGVSDPAGTFAWTDGDTIPTVANSGYEVTFTPTDTANYNPATEIVQITVNKKPLTITGATHTKQYDTTTTATGVSNVIFSGKVNESDNVSALAGSVTAVYTNANAGTTTINITNLTLTGTASGNYSVTLPANGVTVVGGITKAPQAALTIDGGDIDKDCEDIDEVITLSATGGSGTGAVSYAIASSTPAGVISISGSSVTIVKAGTATVTAAKAGDDNYNEVTSAAITITISHNYNWTLTTPVTLNVAASVAGNLVYINGEETGTCACGDTDTRDVSAVPAFTSIANLGEYLQGITATITAANPVAVKLTGVNMNTANWTGAEDIGLYATLNVAGKHAALDLSACTATMPTATNFSGAADAGQKYIVSLVLPNSFTAITAGTDAAPTFQHYTALVHIEGAGVTGAINNYAFGSSTAGNAVASLKSVSFPKAANVIGIGTFQNCTGLTSVNIPAVTNIGSNAFIGCTGLTSVNFTAATNISNMAFSGCTGLTSVNIPAATNIGISVFSSTGATALTVTLGAAPPTVGSVFNNVNAAKPVTVRVPHADKIAAETAGYTGFPLSGADDGTVDTWAEAFRDGGWTRSDTPTFLPGVYGSGARNANVSLTLDFYTP